MKYVAGMCYGSIKSCTSFHLMEKVTLGPEKLAWQTESHFGEKSNTDTGEVCEELA
jgi:hypothetical protein